MLRILSINARVYVMRETYLYDWLNL